MTTKCNENESNPAVLSDFGTFEGFSFRDQCAIDRNLTAQEVVAWNHDADGEAEFWPAGDHAETALVFKGQTSVTASELLDLNRVLEELDDDAMESFLKIYHAIHNLGESLENLTAEKIEDINLNIFVGPSFLDERKEAAYELFELYYPEAYEVWEKTHCDGLIFDVDIFLNSPCWSTVSVRRRAC